MHVDDPNMRLTLKSHLYNDVDNLKFGQERVEVEVARALPEVFERNRYSALVGINRAVHHWLLLQKNPKSPKALVYFPWARKLSQAPP